MRWDYPATDREDAASQPEPGRDVRHGHEETFDFIVIFAARNGDPGMTRTCDLRFRKPPLYPAELRDRCATGMSPVAVS